MHVTARADYAVRAAIELASLRPASATRQRLAEAQRIPGKFLETILGDLRRVGIIEAQRGAAGGYRLARDPATLTLAEIVRVAEGPLAAVRGMPPEDTTYPGSAVALTQVWVAVRASLRDVLEVTTVADVLTGDLPPQVTALLERPDSWTRR
ncbi:Rrf2 family transcriptional regulator [Actinobacteria bacterium YIM 96077]|uniref:Transcriptional regulator n=1 Tax=Phytoactinopolyspora halophila TaxID=1981511 RepID=A0A329QBT5_9ACTN|nr:Rrf2 family transcriptional regulator [Phytoactinopolyspora halophila]AYY12359.1 Rrf2 family transcriptional regulator [Actinobacteria bacterium YIM 96077]RAW09209.1 transcriptional regulator [Phytoactinopolyspora halophila]